MGAIGALPGVAYTERGAMMFAAPMAGGRVLAQVGTWALIDRPPQARAIIVAGRYANLSRAGEVMINETAARFLRAGVGSVIRLRGYRPDQARQVLTGSAAPPPVVLPAVRVVGIIRLPTDLADSNGVPADVSYAGTASVYVTRAFYQRFSSSIANDEGLSFHLRRGLAGLTAFEAGVKRVAGPHAQVLIGSDDAVAAAAAERGTSLQALALLLFGVIMALAMLVIVAQGIARLAYGSSGDFTTLRALGSSRRQLFAVALAPGALICAAGMVLAIPAAYGLSVLTPLGLARQAELSPGLSFNAAILLGGAACLTLLLTGRAAATAWRVVRIRTGRPAAEAVTGGSRAGRWVAGHGFPLAAVVGVRLAFEPGRDATAVPVRSAITGIAVSLAAVIAALIFGSSLARLIQDPAVTGWDWAVAVGNPHSGDTSAQIEPRLRADADVTGYTATSLGDGRLDGRDVTIVGLRAVRGHVVPPVLAGRLPRAPGEIALSGGELRALHKRIGDVVLARPAGRPMPLHITGQVVLSPEITNEQAQLGEGGVMTLAGADAVSGTRLPRNVFLVRLRQPGEQAAIARLKRQFPGVVLPAVPPPAVRNLREVSSLPLTLALLLALLAIATVAHTLVTSVRRRRRELAILKAIGFVRRQVRAAVAWQATAIAVSGLVLGLPLGAVAGRLAWLAFAGQFAIKPVPVISSLVLLAFPALLVLANIVAAFPGRAAARTQPAVTLRTE